VSRLSGTAADAAICTALHGVGSHADPPTMEWAAPVTKNVARQLAVAVLRELEVPALAV
jgi:hypothetical protein